MILVELMQTSAGLSEGPSDKRSACCLLIHFLHLQSAPLVTSHVSAYVGSCSVYHLQVGALVASRG